MNKEREKKLKLLKGLTEEQIINELARRRKVNTIDYKLMWIHKDAFFKTGESIEKVAEAVNKEAEQEAEQEKLKEQLKEKEPQK